jgi:hypothetical protein
MSFFMIGVRCSLFVVCCSTSRYTMSTTVYSMYVCMYVRYHDEIGVHEGDSMRLSWPPGPVCHGPVFTVRYKLSLIMYIQYCTAY